MEYRISWYGENPQRPADTVIEDFGHGIALISSALENCEKHNGSLSCSLSAAQPVQDAPAAQIERLSNGQCIAQLFASENDSPNNEEGWFNLVEDESTMVSIDEDLKMSWDKRCETDFAQVKFAEGVWFAKKLFVSTPFALATLRSFSNYESIKAFLSTRNWEFLGIV